MANMNIKGSKRKGKENKKSLEDLKLKDVMFEFVPHVIQDQTSPESVHDPITSTPALLQVQDLNKACTSRPQSCMALLFDDSVMEAENTSNISLNSPPLTSKHISLTQSSKKTSSLSVYRKRLTLELLDLSAQFIENQPNLVNFTSSTRLQIVD
nr:uncharacterized protein LOC124814282 isoform X2 [Hydra vulgaris]